MSILDAVQNSVQNLISPFFTIESPEYRGQDFPDGLQFQEYDSNGVPSGLPFKLVGNQLPKDRIPYGGKQQLVKEFYPGNPEPTVQVMGSREDDIKIMGRFHDRRIQDPTRNQFYGAASAVAQGIDEIRKRGSICRLKIGEFVRYGFIESSVFKMKNLGDVEYEINFLVIGEVFPTNCKFLKTPLALPQVSNTLLIAAASKFAARAGQIPSTMPLGIGALLNQYIGEVASAVASVTQFIDNVLTAAEDADKLYERGLGLVRNARTACAVFKRRVGALSLAIGTVPIRGGTAVSEAFRTANALFVAETLQGTTRPPDTETDASRARAAALVASFTSKVNTIAAAKAQRGGASIESLLRDMQEQLTLLARSLPRRRVRVVKGMTLQRLANINYKDATKWEINYKHNNLTSTILEVGSIIEIPRL